MGTAPSDPEALEHSHQHFIAISVPPGLFPFLPSHESYFLLPGVEQEPDIVNFMQRIQFSAGLWAQHWDCLGSSHPADHITSVSSSFQNVLAALRMAWPSCSAVHPAAYPQYRVQQKTCSDWGRFEGHQSL